MELIIHKPEAINPKSNPRGSILKPNSNPGRNSNNIISGYLPPITGSIKRQTEINIKTEVTNVTVSLKLGYFPHISINTDPKIGIPIEIKIFVSGVMGALPLVIWLQNWQSKW